MRTTIEPTNSALQLLDRSRKKHTRIIDRIIPRDQQQKAFIIINGRGYKSPGEAEKRLQYLQAGGFTLHAELTTITVQQQAGVYVHLIDIDY
jgi:hypothetical protein